MCVTTTLKTKSGREVAVSGAHDSTHDEQVVQEKGVGPTTASGGPTSLRGCWERSAMLLGVPVFRESTLSCHMGPPCRWASGQQWTGNTGQRPPCVGLHPGASLGTAAHATHTSQDNSATRSPGNAHGHSSFTSPRVAPTTVTSTSPNPFYRQASPGLEW